MDFSLTEAQNDISGLTRRIVDDFVPDEKLEQHGSGGFDRTLWTELNKSGIVDAALPASVGGGGYGLLEQCSVLIELGRSVAPSMYLPSVVMSASGLAKFGTSKQQERWLVPILRGEQLLVPVLADTSARCRVVARLDGERWVLNGSQTAVAGAAFTDGLVVAAETNDGPKIFLVDKHYSGVSIAEQAVVDNSDSGLVTLDNVIVDNDDILGNPSHDVADWLRLHGTVGLCAWQLGVLERALQLTAKYANEREQFGHSLSGFQAVRQRLADAYIDVEAVRLTLWQAAWRLSESLPATEEVCTAKFWAAQAGHRVAHTAVHVHGGVGIDVDYPLHRYFVAAKRAEFTLGGATAQLVRLGECLAQEQQ